MGKFIKMFKSLPPEVRLMLAMLGLGTPVGAIYFLRRFFPTTPLWLVILYIVAGIVVIAILAFIIARIVGRGKRKRSQRMGAELASDATSGPTKVDAAAAIKANNEKFFNAVKEMRKEAHISVYDLPWYIVIGDSGCGKTFLVNNAGLTFSLGKPEGYKLGTLNYNWWFTEDAVFVDMAGRLCNPQDDGDRREWEAFLNTVGKGRRGFPINGAVVCVSMEHLLNDPPEKHESDAVIALERLRDLQSKLGVTFATYIVVTKSDRLVGFLQYFDRPDKGSIKNQIFGWSRPGEFNEMHDPDKFQDVFDSMYSRLHELRLRRLNDEADEIDLGLAYAFPEEFRRMYEPLQVYVRTIFPMLRNPRAVKNLLFRGLYFTSATQDDMIPPGAVERYGAEGADQLAKLQALFPKTAYFIKDVLFRKVFPEHGLVFRNEQQVTRHRKLAKALWIGTVALFIGAGIGLFFGYRSLERVIGTPSTEAQKIAGNFGTMSADDRLARAETFKSHAETLNNSFAAWWLSLGVGTERPVRAMMTIEARLVETAMEMALKDVDEALRAGDALKADDPALARKYLAAVKSFLAWYGCRHKTEGTTGLTGSQFSDMWSVVQESRYVEEIDLLTQRVDWYFKEIVGNADFAETNPARHMPEQSDQTLLAALDHIYTYFMDYYARLDPERLTDESIRAWRQILKGCNDARDAYHRVMNSSAAANDIANDQDLSRFVQNFGGDLDAFSAALNAVTGGKSGEHEAPAKTMLELIQEVRATWFDYQSELNSVVNRQSCVVTDEKIKASIASLTGKDPTFDRVGLDCEFWQTLEELGIVAKVTRCSSELFEKEELEKLVIKAKQICPEIIEFEEARRASDPGTIRLTKSASTVREILSDVRQRLKFDLSGDAKSGSRMLRDWEDTIQDFLDEFDSLVDYEAKAEQLASVPDDHFWRRDDLKMLLKESTRLVGRGNGTILLHALLAQARTANQSELGMAEFSSSYDRDRRLESAYFVRNIVVPDRDVRQKEDARPQKVEEEDDASKRPQRSRPRRGRESDERTESRKEVEPAREAPIRDDRTDGIPSWASRDFLFKQMDGYVWLDVLLKYMKSREAYLLVDDSRDRRGTDLVDQCRRELEISSQRYMKTFCAEWVPAYQDKNLDALASLEKDLRTWDDLVRALDTSDAVDQVSGEFRWAIEDVLRTVPFATMTESGVRWRNYEEKNKEVIDHWTRLEDWMRGACDDAWRPFGLTAGDIRHDSGRRADGTAPSRAIAGELGAALRQLLNAVRDNGALPREFDGSQRWGHVEIPWGNLSRVCQSHGFKNNEKLTASVIGFERRLLAMLSNEITQRMKGIEDHHFSGRSSGGGWPYLNGAKYTASGLDTVDFRTFTSFLIQMHNAGRTFASVEKHLPEDAPGKRARQDYMKHCDAWFSFLKLKPDINAVPVDLPISVKVAALAENDAQAQLCGERLEDTLQHVARAMYLDLGLVLPNAARNDGALQITPGSSDRGREHQGTWRWNPGGSRSLSVRIELQADENLERGEPLEKTLGRLSPLAICAYLERYGCSQDRREWYVLHGWKRDPTAAKSSKTVGERLIFTLGDGRSLPAPIRKLGF